MSSRLIEDTQKRVDYSHPLIFQLQFRANDFKTSKGGGREFKSGSEFPDKYKKSNDQI